MQPSCLESESPMVIHVCFSVRQLHHLVQPHGVDSVPFFDAGVFWLEIHVNMRWNGFEV